MTQTTDATNDPQADLLRMSSPAQVLEALCDNRITTDWIIGRLKHCAENSATPVQLACLKMLIELMANGGLISRTTMMAYKRAVVPGKSKKSAQEGDDDLDGEGSVVDIDSVVQESLKERHDTYDENNDATPFGGRDADEKAGGGPAGSGETDD